jgi:hypothetical protein
MLAWNRRWGVPTPISEPLNVNGQLKKSSFRLLKNTSFPFPLHLGYDAPPLDTFDLGGQRHLRMHAEIASALGNRDVSEARVAHSHRKYYGYTTEGQPALQTGDLGRAHPGWCRQVGQPFAQQPITKNCVAKIGNAAFHQFFRRIVPVTAYDTENRPVSKMANPNRSVGWRPISIMSLANPMVLKVKKTPIREIMSVFRGTVPHIDLVVFIGYAPLGRIVL